MASGSRVSGEERGASAAHERLLDETWTLGTERREKRSPSLTGACPLFLLPFTLTPHSELRVAMEVTY